MQKLSSISQIWKTKGWPADWKNSTFLTLPKKGDVSECKNNRTIALISHLSKILLHIINERLRPILDRELPAEQAGFRRGGGTRDQISNIRHILEKCTEFNRKIYLCFIDYAKAFDCIRHSALWKALLEMGVPTHFVKLISNLYMTTSKPVFEQRRVTQTGSISARVLDKVVSCLLHSSSVCRIHYETSPGKLEWRSFHW